MAKSTNHFSISTDIPLKFERLKVSLKENDGLLWTDFLVLCAIAELEKSSMFVKTSDIVRYIGKNRGWVYAAVKRLKQKQLIGQALQARINQPREIWINGLGHSFVRRKFRMMKREDYLGSVTS